MPKFFTLLQTSEMLGKSPKALRALMGLGRFPYSKIGGRILIEEPELQKYLELSRRTTAEAAARQMIATPETGKEAA